MKAETKTARVSARISPNVYNTLTEASEITGSTLNQFIVHAALEKAQAIIEHENKIMHCIFPIAPEVIPKNRLGSPNFLISIICVITLLVKMFCMHIIPIFTNSSSIINIVW